VAIRGGSPEEGEIIQKGFIPVPERAGLGVEMDDEFVRKAQIPGTPWFVPD
jgi:L-alanine-DL-glutamate epimerase-like enolase superfamily enzyme